jgi:hypothetical protein
MMFPGGHTGTAYRAEPFSSFGKLITIIFHKNLQIFLVLHYYASLDLQTDLSSGVTSESSTWI